MSKRVILIAYHFPPVRISSGIQRTLKFATYLRVFGWEPTVLTAHPRAYETVSGDQLSEVPNDIIVQRAFALDTARHLSFHGRYLGSLALPDRWVSWLPAAVWHGLRLIRKQRPAVIWSTFPIATAHLIGGLLHRATGLPWIADFRDPMTEDDYPPDPRRRQVFRRIERYAVRNAARCIFTTQGTRAMYARRYPEAPIERWAVIPNGFDEENFLKAEELTSGPPVGDHPLRLVHSGILYPSERDPTQLFEALRCLKQSGEINSRELRVVLRATAHDELYRSRISALGLDDIIELAPSLPYTEALAEMLSADGLLLFQAANCNHQVPAKLYEYFRAGRPILALTDPAGDTAMELRSAGIGRLAPLDDKRLISQSLLAFLGGVRKGTEAGVDREQAAAFSRRGGAGTLADILNEVTGAG